MVTIRAFDRRKASRTLSMSSGLPQSASTRTGLPPHRSTSSGHALAEEPVDTDEDFLPGSTRLATHVSIPAPPVPDMLNVTRLPVSKTCRRSV